MERLRVEAARRLSTETAALAKRFAERYGFGFGFGFAGTMRRAVLPVMGIPPADYRERFGPG